ncbi:MAG: hemolysin family protein [Opitutales bacterium]
MIATFYAAVAFTIVASALCSLLEAFILSTSPTEIESLKKKAPKRGEMLEKFRREIEETSSAILSLNTIANTAGASYAGVLFANAFQGGNANLYTLLMTVSILVFSEILPKNIGVLYRPALQPYLVYPLLVIRVTMWPISRLASLAVKVISGGKQADAETSDEDIIMMARKSAEEGEITLGEQDMISNALSLDTIPVEDLMTPRTVVTALDETSTVGEVFKDFKNIPFARLPVYNDNIDGITGVVRRRDLLAAMARDEYDRPISELRQDVLIIPENASAADALQVFLKNHQQLAVSVDEYGSVAGVITMEDIIEALLGQEIFEDDDVAIDMRELAKKKFQADKKKSASRVNRGTTDPSLKSA